MTTIFVNQVKLKRANEIIALVSGTVSPKTEAEIEIKAKFTAILEEAGVKISKDKTEAVSFVYEKLGGLIREQEASEEAHKTSARKPVASKANDDEDEDDDD